MPVNDDLDLLTRAEKKQLRFLESVESSTVRSGKYLELGQSWWMKTCWVPFTVLALWAVAALSYLMLKLVPAEPGDPEAVRDAITLLVLTVPIAALCSALAARRLRRAFARLVPDYLASLDLPARKAHSPERADHDPSGRTYPVTDGGYDPDLYSRRGGRETYARMRALGVDNHTTYQNNFLEAE